MSANTIEAEGVGSFFKNLGRISVKTGKKLATNVIKNPGRSLGNTSKNATAAAIKSPKAGSSLSEVVIFDHTGKSSYLEKLV